MYSKTCICTVQLCAHKQCFICFYFNSLPALQAPSQVTGVTLVKLVYNRRPALTVNWSAPQSDVSIIQYHVQFRRSGNTAWGTQVQFSGSPPPTSTILMSLDAGTEYDVRVRAVSSNEDGEWSEVQTERTYSSKLNYIICCYQLHVH